MVDGLVCVDLSEQFYCLADGLHVVDEKAFLAFVELEVTPICVGSSEADDLSEDVSFVEGIVVVGSEEEPCCC